MVSAKYYQRIHFNMSSLPHRYDRSHDGFWELANCQLVLIFLTSSEESGDKLFSWNFSLHVWSFLGHKASSHS